MSPRKFIVFPGAHKTASTHLQRTLRRNAGRLAKRGVVFIGPNEVRTHLTPLTYRLRDGEPADDLGSKAAAAIAPLIDGAEVVLIADENILGGTEARMLFRKGRLYPWGPGRLGRVLKLLPEGKHHIALAIRHQATFLVSNYAESLHHTAYQSFEDYLALAKPHRLSWSRFIDRLRVETGDIPLTIWRYEDYPSVVRSVFSRLIGDGLAQKLEVPDRVIHPGLSARAVEALAAGETDIAALKKRFPKSPEYPALSLWTEEERARLGTLYARDLEQLSQMKGIRLIP